jgi:hypothetical protein
MRRRDWKATERFAQKSKSRPKRERIQRLDGRFGGVQQAAVWRRFTGKDNDLSM